MDMDTFRKNKHGIPIRNTVAYKTSLRQNPPQLPRIKRKKISRSLVAIVRLKTGGRCAYCGKPLEGDVRATIDHVTPLSACGSNKEENLLPVCFSCNVSKGSLALWEFRSKLAKQRRHGGVEPTFFFEGGAPYFRVKKQRESR